MSSLWFVVPVYRRLDLTRICLDQLRRTCDALTQEGVAASAVVIGDDENLDAARDLGFGTAVRDNQFVSAKYNDGIQLACDPELEPRKECGVYRVLGKRDYRAHKQGDEFVAQLDPKSEYRAVMRGAIERAGSVTATVGEHTRPDGWKGPVDYVVPCGSDDWVDHRLFLDLPPAATVVGFQRLSFVRPDGREMVQRFVNVRGGCGIRIYPVGVFEKVDYRPADEDKHRACDTSILTNVWRAARPQVIHRELDPKQIIDWKSPDIQLNPYESLTFHRAFANPQDPFEALAGLYPADALAEMARHYDRARQPAVA